MKKPHESRKLGACRKRMSCSFCDKIIVIGSTTSMESFIKSCCEDKGNFQGDCFSEFREIFFSQSISLGGEEGSMPVHDVPRKVKS